jgi:hypothetical protein
MNANPNEHENLVAAMIDESVGRLSEDERRRLHAGIAASAELREHWDSIRDVTGALRRWRVPEPPRDLAGRVLARIAEHDASTIIPFERSVAASERSGGGAAPWFSVKELVAVAASLALIVGIIMPGNKYARDRMQRAACMSNIQGVMAGLGGYHAMYEGALPYAGPTPEGAHWRRDVPVGVRQVSNTRHFYLLVRGHFVDPSSFACPARPDAIAMATQNADRFRDFPQAANCSYSTQNQAGPRPTIFAAGRLAVLADTNPLFDPLVRRLAPSYTRNSFTHSEGAGQNVLYRDGSARWEREPTVGVAGDHIYRAGDRTRYNGDELPVAETDSFLIP